MLSRSAKAAAQGRAILSPLSPLPSPYVATLSTAAQITLDQCRAQRMGPTRKGGKLIRALPLLHISSPSSPRFMSPTTAAALGFDGSIMERLQTVLASPFSPKTFTRSIFSPAPKSSEAPVLHMTRTPPPPKASTSTGSRVNSLKPRRKAPPAMLSLTQPARSSEHTPLSPFRYPRFAVKAALFPVSPTTSLSRVSPVTTLTEAQIHLQKMEKLSRCLGESVPKELVYPSFGQVAEQADNVSSYLELYRAGSSVDDSIMGLLSAVPRETHWEDIALGETRLERSGSQRSLRRSRSLGDFFSITDIREMQSHNSRVVARKDAVAIFPCSPTGLMSPPATARPARDDNDNDIHTRKRSVANARASIIGTDAKLMAQFRLGFGGPAPPMPGVVPATPISPTSVPSAFFAVKSPRAPYWVKPTYPKTPRTLRVERRMGWGGPWNVGSMGAMMSQLKEL